MVRKFQNEMSLLTPNLRVVVTLCQHFGIRFEAKTFMCYTDTNCDDVGVFSLLLTPITNTPRNDTPYSLNVEIKFFGYEHDPL